MANGFKIDCRLKLDNQQAPKQIDYFSADVNYSRATLPINTGTLCSCLDFMARAAMVQWKKHLLAELVAGFDSCGPRNDSDKNLFK